MRTFSLAQLPVHDVCFLRVDETVVSQLPAPVCMLPLTIAIPSLTTVMDSIPLEL